MFLPRPLKKFVAIFRGEVSPILILISVMLGFWFGLTPGWYGIHAALLAVVLVLNVHVGIFLMFAGFGKTACFAAAPLLFHAGAWTQDSLGGLLAVLAAIPVIGITDFSRYAVAGAALLGPITGLILGLLISQSVVRFRKSWLAFEEGSEKLRIWRSKGWVKLLDRLLIGKSTSDVRAVLKRRPKLVRLPGVILAAVLLGGSAVGLSFVQDRALKDYAAKSLTQANGAEVNLESLELAVFSGRLSATGVQVTDPDNPQTNRIAIGTLTADASLWNLLLGRVVMDQVELTDVRFDQPRAAPGAVTVSTTKSESPPQSFDAASFGLSAAGDLNKLQDYFQNAQSTKEWLAKAREWLPKPQGAPSQQPKPVPEKYLEYLSARAPSSPTPRILLRSVTLDPVQVPSEYFGPSKIVCTNLSDAPVAAGLPVAIEVHSNATPNQISIIAHYESPDGAAEITATFHDIPLAELQANLNPANPVTFQEGTVSATISGTASRTQIDLQARIQTKGMKARTTGTGLLGLDPKVATEAFKIIENMETTLRLVGPIAEPRLVFDGPALRAALRDALIQGGKARLASQVDELLGDKLPDGGTEAILKDPASAATKGLGSLLNRKKDDQKKQDPEDQPEKEDQQDKKVDPFAALKNRLKK